MSDFNWETEEDSAWQAANQLSRGEKRPKRWRPIYTLVLVLLLAVVWGVWQINKRADAAVESIETEVLTSHNLVMQAAAEQDRELLTNLLSGRDLEWVDDQNRLVESGLLFDRPFINLSLDLQNTQPPTITLSSDLTEAELLAHLTYRTADSDQLITLAHTAVYRRGEARWLLSPRNDEAWLEQELLTTDHLIITYPPPDEEIVTRLANDLEATIAQSCATFFDVVCDENLRLKLSLAAEPLSLTSWDENRSFSGDIFVLPTPRLIGLPIDEASYQALYRGYAGRIISAVLERTLAQRWGQDSDIYTAAYRSHLFTLGLAEAHDPALETPFPQAAPDVAALCYATEGPQLHIINPEQTDVIVRDAGGIPTELIPSPNGRTLAVREVPATPNFVNFNRISTWRKEQEEPFFSKILSLDTDFGIFWRKHPQRPKLFLLNLDIINSSVSLTPYEAITFDDERCQNGTCLPLRNNFASDVIWSPDGKHTLLPMLDGQIFLGDAEGNPVRYVDRANLAYWVDENTFHYLRRSGDAGIFSATIDSQLTDPIIDQSSLLPLVPESQRPNRFLLAHAEPNPTNPDQILILGLAINGQLDGTAFVFLHTISSGETVVTVQSDRLHAFEMSPDGRFIHALIFNDAIASYTVGLYDIEDRMTTAVSIPHVPRPPILNWSPDGRWLLLVIDGQLLAYDVESSEVSTIRPHADQLATCFDAAWFLD